MCALGKLVNKTERIVIRCTPELYKKWKLFLLNNRKKFKTSSDALEYLLSKEEVVRITSY